jgi:hypothetical protein
MAAVLASTVLAPGYSYYGLACIVALAGYGASDVARERGDRSAPAGRHEGGHRGSACIPPGILRADIDHYRVRKFPEAKPCHGHDEFSPLPRRDLVRVATGSRDRELGD